MSDATLSRDVMWVPSSAGPVSSAPSPFSLSSVLTRRAEQTSTQYALHTHAIPPSTVQRLQLTLLCENSRAMSSPAEDRAWKEESAAAESLLRLHHPRHEATIHRNAAEVIHDDGHASASTSTVILASSPPEGPFFCDAPAEDPAADQANQTSHTNTATAAEDHTAVAPPPTRHVLDDDDLSSVVSVGTAVSRVPSLVTASSISASSAAFEATAVVTHLTLDELGYELSHVHSEDSMAVSSPVASDLLLPMCSPPPSPRDKSIDSSGWPRTSLMRHCMHRKVMEADHQHLRSSLSPLCTSDTTEVLTASSDSQESDVFIAHAHSPRLFTLSNRRSHFDDTHDNRSHIVRDEFMEASSSPIPLLSPLPLIGEFHQADSSRSIAVDDATWAGVTWEVTNDFGEAAASRDSESSAAVPSAAVIIETDAEVTTVDLPRGPSPPLKRRKLEPAHFHRSRKADPHATAPPSLSSALPSRLSLACKSHIETTISGADHETATPPSVAAHVADVTPTKKRKVIYHRSASSSVARGERAGAPRKISRQATSTPKSKSKKPREKKPRRAAEKSPRAPPRTTRTVRPTKNKSTKRSAARATSVAAARSRSSPSRRPPQPETCASSQPAADAPAPVSIKAVEEVTCAEQAQLTSPVAQHAVPPPPLPSPAPHQTPANAREPRRRYMARHTIARPASTASPPRLDTTEKRWVHSHSSKHTRSFSECLAGILAPTSLHSASRCVFPFQFASPDPAATADTDAAAAAAIHQEEKESSRRRPA